jgi:hypothetical protein
VLCYTRALQAQVQGVFVYEVVVSALLDFFFLFLVIVEIN